MRVAAVYDVHGNLPALEAVLEEVRGERPEMILFGGDLVSGPLPRETLEVMLSLGPRARFVLGNADRWFLDVYDGRWAWCSRRASPSGCWATSCDGATAS